MIEITSYEFSDSSFSFIWSLWPGSDEVTNVMIIIRKKNLHKRSNELTFDCLRVLRPAELRVRSSYSAAISRHFVLVSITADQIV